jgi:hypothetical protein
MATMMDQKNALGADNGFDLMIRDQDHGTGWRADDRQGNCQ